MYNKLESCVKQGVDVSENCTVNKGTRQGCNMSPTLFKLYLSDFAKEFIEEKSNLIEIGTSVIESLSG